MLPSKVSRSSVDIGGAPKYRSAVKRSSSRTSDESKRGSTGSVSRPGRSSTTFLLARSRDLNASRYLSLGSSKRRCLNNSLACPTSRRISRRDHLRASLRPAHSSDPHPAQPFKVWDRESHHFSWFKLRQPTCIGPTSAKAHIGVQPTYNQRQIVIRDRNPRI